MAARLSNRVLDLSRPATPGGRTSNSTDDFIRSHCLYWLKIRVAKRGCTDPAFGQGGESDFPQHHGLYAVFPKLRQDAAVCSIRVPECSQERSDSSCIRTARWAFFWRIPPPVELRRS